MSTITQLNQTIVGLQRQVSVLREQLSFFATSSDSPDFAAVLLEQSANLESSGAKPDKNSNVSSTGLVAEQASSLLAETEQQALAGKPSLHEFMEMTGVDATIGTEILYGVIGSNSDLRNWSKILSAADPLTAARRATAQMYSSVASYQLGNHEAFGTLNYITVLEENSIGSDERSSNGLAFESVTFENGLQKDMLVSSSNLLLRGTSGTSEEAERISWLFGLDA